MSLALVEVKETSNPQPAAFHELAAAKYLGMNRSAFREIVFDLKLIPFAQHANGRTRIYLRSDLDAYLSGLDWRKMDARKDSRAALKGVAK